MENDMEVEENNSTHHGPKHPNGNGHQSRIPHHVSIPKYGPPEIDPSEIEKLRVLGDGSFGTVYAGKCRQKDVAVKVLLKQDYDEKTLEAFRHEVEVMSKIYHPNINLFMGACTVTGKLMIVTELMKGDLESMLLQELNITLLTRMKMAKDAALGVLWLHSSNPQIIHRDLKASNLLVDDNLNCKICDFGLSQLKARGKNLVDGSDGAKGTPLWMAPEVMMGEEFNEKADVYSFGLILWFLLTGKEPYSEFEDLDVFSHAVCIQHFRPAIPANCDALLRDLITRCLAPRPSDRPNFTEIVNCLDHVIVNCAIEDPVGRKFWKENFAAKDNVPWNDFLNAFAKLLHIVPVQHSNLPLSYILMNYPDILQNSTLEIDVKCLKAILADETKTHGAESDEDYVVSIEKFGNILKWLSPLQTLPNDVNIMQRIRQLMTEGWFHGDISTQESESRLLNKPEGTFLIRFSTSSPGCYTISKVSVDGTIKHQKIQHSPNGLFEINNRGYKSLQELVQLESQSLNLYTACVGSRFLPLFLQQKISGYVN